LNNDTDVDSPSLAAVLDSGPAHGLLTLNPNGSFTYTPAVDYHGTDSFTYHAFDGELSSNIVTVTLTIHQVYRIFLPLAWRN
jgi:large repetitive protein